jgi:hypothetical protein
MELGASPLKSLKPQPHHSRALRRRKLTKVISNARSHARLTTKKCQNSLGSLSCHLNAETMGMTDEAKR